MQKNDLKRLDSTLLKVLPQGKKDEKDEIILRRF